jgi:hypothetical protein
VAQLQDQPLLGSPRPDEVADNSTPTDTLVNYLLCTVQRQTSITEEQNRRIVDLEWSKRQLISLCNAPSPPCIKGGRSPHPSRSRSPRYSASMRSPSRSRRSPRRKSPRQSPPRRSPPRRNRHSWSSSSSEDDRDARIDLNAYSPFMRRIREAQIPHELEKPRIQMRRSRTSRLSSHTGRCEAPLSASSSSTPSDEEP